MVTLINNLGVTKSVNSPNAAVIDPTQAQSVVLNATAGIDMSSVALLHGQTTITAASEGFSVVVPSGGVVILEKFSTKV